ncbi:MAG TPA: 16S rRNA (cytidine(1402)-2'-O)-methyltransferase [Candidatus Paceibacterota bacterium]|nr:16S rRNA (cytidine(1402)-2'-O)-methyltransferase [Candidatus Paceibacterota bacterium]
MGTLSIVATPIGNLEDITLRALRVLKEADCILCEDTRVTAKLLAKYEISKPLIRCDEKTEEKTAHKTLAMLAEGKKLALVSDAGTPGISDPGARLVARIRSDAPEVTIEAIPGPSALTAALSIAGLESGDFTFLGFLPHKKGRQTALKEIASSTHPVVLFESPHRIEKLMGELAAVAPDRQVLLFRELTKVHEQVLSGTPQELMRRLEDDNTARGEFVVIVREA